MGERHSTQDRTEGSDGSARSMLPSIQREPSLLYMAASRKSQGKEQMTDESPALAANMSQRAVMRYLSRTEWKLVFQLPVPVGTGMLDRMRDHGWIELCDIHPRT